MVFKPKKKVKENSIDKKKAADKLAIKELRKKIEEAQADLNSAEEEELEEDIEDEVEDEIEEDSEEEVEEDSEVPDIEPPEIEPPKIEKAKSTKEKQVEETQLKLTAEEVISAIEFNIARAGQLLQLLK